MSLEELKTKREAYLTVIGDQLECIEKAKQPFDVVQFNTILDSIYKIFEDVKSLNRTIERLSDIHSLKEEIVQAKKHSLDLEIKLGCLEEYRQSHAFVVKQQISVDCQESYTGPSNTITEAHNNKQRPNTCFLKRSLSCDSFRKEPIGKNDRFIRGVEIYLLNKPKKRKLQRSQSCEKSDVFRKTKPWVIKRSSSCDGRITNTKKSSKIRDLASQEEFGYWTKCVLALNRTRGALLSPVRVKFNELVMSFPEEELAIFRTFLKCNNVKHLQSNPRKKRNWECEHNLCEIHFKTLLDKHKTTDNWIITIKPLCTSSPAGNKENKSSDRMWEIGRLYTYLERGDDESTYNTIEGLDVAKIIKLMRCCKLFEFEGCDEVYDKVVKTRNVLMHSVDNMTTNKELTETFEWLIELLEHFIKFPDCEKALAELQKFKEDELVVDIESPEFKRQEEEALQLQAAALEEEVLKSKEVAESLQLLLKKTSDRLERIQVERQENRERMNSEISSLKGEHQNPSMKVDSESNRYTHSTKTFEKHNVEENKDNNTKVQSINSQKSDRYYTKLTQLQQSYDDLKLKNQTLQDEIKSLRRHGLENKKYNPNLRMNDEDLIKIREQTRKKISDLKHNNKNKHRLVNNTYEERNAKLNGIIKNLEKQNKENTKAMEEHKKSLKNKLAQLAEKNKELEIEINEARKEILKMRWTAATEISSLKAQNEKLSEQNETWAYLNDKIKQHSHNMDKSEIRRRVEMVLMADESALSEINKILKKNKERNLTSFLHRKQVTSYTGKK